MKYFTSDGAIEYSPLEDVLNYLEECGYQRNRWQGELDTLEIGQSVQIGSETFTRVD